MMGRILSDRRYNGESSQIQCHVSGKLGNNDEQATGLSHRQNRPVTAYIGTHTEGYDIYDPVPSRSPDICQLHSSRTRRNATGKGYASARTSEGAMMDRPFNLADWHPTLPSLSDFEKQRLEPRLLPAFAARLIEETKEIQRHPYDPKAWVDRGYTLMHMKYPELAAGDALKALRVSRGLLKHLLKNRHKKWGLGYRMGFWMIDEEDETCKPANSDDDINMNERPCAYEQRASELDSRISHIMKSAEALEEANLDLLPETREGQYLQRPYPWMEERHLRRSDALIQEINMEFQKAVDMTSSDPVNAAKEIPKTYCILQRDAFGDGSREVLGVFAARDIPEDAIILVDQTHAWGCTGPETDDGSLNVSGGSGCRNPFHPNLPGEDASQNLHWVCERAGIAAADTLVNCRLFIRAIQDGTPHPLDHTLIARLTPTYHKKQVKRFHMLHDLEVLNDCLTQFGIDIFANLAYDTWVLFTVHARVVNNAWDVGTESGVSPLFSLINHSCSPNAKWCADKDDHTILRITTTRPIRAGEQIFVRYDEYSANLPLQARRQRLSYWFDKDCQCLRCHREEREQLSVPSNEPSNVPRDVYGFASWRESMSDQIYGDWDTEEKPVFPEDEMNARLAERRKGVVLGR